MAEIKKQEPLSRRDELAQLASIEFLRYNIQNNRFGQEDVVARYAYLYADAMIAQSAKAPVKTVVSRGVVAQPEAPVDEGIYLSKLADQKLVNESLPVLQ